MKVTFLCLAACSIACGQGSKSNSKFRNELLEKINNNLEHQNQVLHALYAHSYHQQNSLNQSLNLVEKNIENTKSIVQEIGNTKAKSNEAINTVELFNNFTKGISNWAESMTNQISNSQRESSRNIENFTKSMSKWQKDTIKMIGERFESFSNHLKNQFTEVSDQDKINPPTSCKEVSGTESGLYYIRIKAVSEKPFQVFCDQDFENGGWTVIQRRVDNSTNFNLDWKNYKNGFGDLSRNFWIGLEKLHLMTSKKRYELGVIVEDFYGKRGYAKYDRFVVGSEREGYSLKVLGNYTGTAGNALEYHRGMKFSTYDNDNDEEDDNCAKDRRGGWWFKDCALCHLNGQYLEKGRNEIFNINWVYLKPNFDNLKFTEMMIRPL